MPLITSFGEIEADGTTAHDNHSADFTVTKNGITFLLHFNRDMSRAIINATAKTTLNADPGVVALVERGRTPTDFEIRIVQASNGISRDDRGFWFMAFSSETARAEASHEVRNRLARLGQFDDALLYSISEENLLTEIERPGRYRGNHFFDLGDKLIWRSGTDDKECGDDEWNYVDKLEGDSSRRIGICESGLDWYEIELVGK